MNSKNIFHDQEYSSLDEMTPEVRREYCAVVAQFARIPPPTEAQSIVSWIHDPLMAQGSILTRILVIVLAALVIVGLIALAVSVFSVH
jgi:hypothetical protein